MSSSSAERDSLVNRIYDINEKDFDSVAIDLWRYQYDHNPLYQFYCNLLGANKLKVTSPGDIPFLPISFFRGHKIQTGHWHAEKIFKSSGTTGSVRSLHYIRDTSWYHHIALRSFEKSFGDPAIFSWIALLPTYSEREDSSLVHMVNYFMQQENQNGNRFFNDAGIELINILKELSAKNQKTILIGVSFALLNLFEKHEVPAWDELVIMETGGMKGRGPEITREELHDRIRSGNPDLNITSEYGMTELLSQAYLVNEKFQPGPTMKVFTREISDPLNLLSAGQRGAINVIDLGNVDTCAFVATDDIGIVYGDGNFEVLGRVDLSDVRGCNLMYL